eukprot:m.86742 g.86742  ORF g.86742 m.86742 type:complete len:328 (-) comp15107_c0_seq1:191-1174(-)
MLAVAARRARSSAGATAAACNSQRVNLQCQLQRGMATAPVLSPAQAAKFREDGFLVLDRYYGDSTLRQARAAIDRLIQQFDPAQHPRSIFSTKAQSGDEYFITSGDKISYFFEEYAFDKEGNLSVPLDKSLNKIGHALHILDKTFHDITHDKRNKEIATALGLKNPVVPQSMYIFKQPGIGGEVRPHQDSTFLHTAPMTTLGFWVPLQDCSKANGCLWAIPGSHKQGLRNNLRFVRTKDKALQAAGKFGIGTTFTAEQYDCDEADFVPLEIPAGSLVLIHGEVIHKSDRNASSQSRHAYTWHCIEGSAHYDTLNWLQPSKGNPFPPL